MKCDIIITRLKQLVLTILIVPTPITLGALTSLCWRPDNLSTLMQNASIIMLALFAPLIIGILIQPYYDKNTDALRSLERRVISQKVLKFKSLMVIIVTVVTIPFVVSGDNWLWLETIALSYWSFIMVGLFLLLLDSIRWVTKKRQPILSYFGTKPESSPTPIKSIWLKFKLEVGVSLDSEEKMAAWVELWKSSPDPYAYPLDSSLFEIFHKDVDTFLNSDNEDRLRDIFLVIKEFSDSFDKRSKVFKSNPEKVLPKLEEWHDKLENMHDMSELATKKLLQTKQSLSTLMTELKAESAEQKQADSADEQADSSAEQTD